jgi:outer membrane protein assembly factor BamB
VIIGSCSGSVYALDRATGDPTWLYDTSEDGPPAQFHGEPLIAGEQLIIPTDADPKGHLYSFDIPSGELLWKIAFNRGVTSTPLLLRDRVIVVSWEGDVAAVELKSGKILWRASPFGKLQSDVFIPSPTHASNRILVADNTNQIVALDPSNGTTVWRTKLSGRPNASLIVIGDDVLSATADGYLNSISIKSGQLKKRIKLEGLPFGTPVQSDGLLFVLAQSGTSKLIALDRKSLEVRWRQETPKEWTTYRPLVTKSTIVVGSEDKDLCAFDRVTGERKWCRAVGQMPRGLGLSNDGVLYVGSRNGLVQAFRIDAPEKR